MVTMMKTVPSAGSRILYASRSWRLRRRRPALTGRSAVGAGSSATRRLTSSNLGRGACLLHQGADLRGRGGECIAGTLQAGDGLVDRRAVVGFDLVPLVSPRPPVRRRGQRF